MAQNKVAVPVEQKRDSVMVDDDSRIFSSEPSACWEAARFLASLSTILVLMAACAVAPLVVAVVVSPWLGLLVAAGGFWVWGRFGPRPCPGLLPGLLCLWGVAAILGAMIACAVLVVRTAF